MIQCDYYLIQGIDELVHSGSGADHVMNEMNDFMHGTLQAMSHPVDSVLRVSQKLHELRERIVALDAERAALQQQLNACLEELNASVAEQRVPPPDSSTLTERVLTVLHQNRDRPLAPMDVANILGIRNAQELTNLRVLMSRMSRDGRIEKVTRARYLPRGARER